MIGSGVALFALLSLALLYVNSRRKGRLLSREFAQMKTVTDRIFEQMRTGVATVDDRGFITLANSAFEEVFGYNNCIGSKWDDVVRSHELSRSSLGTSHKSAVEREVEITPDGRRRTLLVAVSPLGSEGERTSGFVAVAYDITQLRGLERDAARKVRLSEMGNLAAGVAHEIRNPLNTISIAVQRLAAEFKPTHDAQDYQVMTTQIQSETKRLNEIITKFLSLAREEEQKPAATKLDLSALIDETVRFMRPETEGLGIEITAQIDPGLTIEAGSDVFKQVLTNLFANAKEAMAGQGGAIAIAAREDQDQVSILFADSGPGIGRDIREEIFQPYFTTKAGGTGLGLTTVHKIVTDLGGSIRLQDDYNDGAAFIITLPR